MGLAAGLVGGQEGLLLQDAGQGLPTDHATDAAPTNDLVAIRLQCRVPWLLPLPDQAVVRQQARLVLPAHGPRLPNSSPALMRRQVTLQLGVLFGQTPVAGAQRIAHLPHLQVLVCLFSPRGSDAHDSIFVEDPRQVITSFALPSVTGGGLRAVGLASLGALFQEAPYAGNASNRQ